MRVVVFMVRVVVVSMCVLIFVMNMIVNMHECILVMRVSM